MLGFPDSYLENQRFSTERHVARLVVMETVAGKFRGYVHIRRWEEEPAAEVPHQTDEDFEREDLAQDAGVSLALKVLRQLEF